VSLSKTNVIELTKLKNNYLTCIMLSLGLLSSATILYICYKLQLKNNVKQNNNYSTTNDNDTSTLDEKSNNTANSSTDTNNKNN